MRSGAAWVSLRGGRAAAGAGPGSAAVAPARSARSHRRQRRQPAVPAVPRVSRAALTENGLFGGVCVGGCCLSVSSGPPFRGVECRGADPAGLAPRSIGAVAGCRIKR